MAGLLFFVAASAIVSGTLPQEEPVVHGGTISESFERIGHLFFTWHMAAVDILTLVLLCGFIGASALLRERNT